MTSNTPTEVLESPNAFPSRKTSVQRLECRPYQLHGFTLIDRHGSIVGLVDWTWTVDSSASIELIGTKLRWLRGSARAVPAFGMKIDFPRRRITVDQERDEILAAPRFPINRPLTPLEKRAAARHYRPQAAPRGLPSLERAAA
jgi:hypothetical protein